MQNEHYLALCDSHNSIIHEYGSDISCQKISAICLRGCSEYEHRQKSSKHEFIHAREIYTMVNQIRFKYKAFQKDIKDYYLKRYITQLKVAIENFEAKIDQKFQLDYPLPQIFSRSGDEGLHALLEDEEDDLEFSQLKCKDIFHLKQLYSYLEKDKKKDEEKRITKILIKIFEDYLRQLKLLGPAPVAASKLAAHKNERKFEVLEGENIEDFSQFANKLMKQLDQFKLKADNLVIKIKDCIALPPLQQPPSSQLNDFVSAAKDILDKITPSQLVIAVKQNFIYHRGEMLIAPYWQKVMQTFKRQGLKHIRVIFTKVGNNENLKLGAQLAKTINDMLNRQVRVAFEARDWEKDPEYFDPIL